jgi:hypothetical protein
MASAVVYDFPGGLPNSLRGPETDSIKRNFSNGAK